MDTSLHVFKDSLVCPWGKKPLTFPLNSPRLLVYGRLINTDIFYGPLMPSVKNNRV